MKSRLFCSLLFLMVLSQEVFGTGLSPGQDSGIDLRKESFNFERSNDWSLTVGALQYINLGLQYQYNFQPSPLFSLQAMAGLNRFTYNLYSSSDKHVLEHCWLPISVGSRINLYRNTNFAGFVFGNYGWALGLGGDNNEVKSNPCTEFGIGVLLHTKKRMGIKIKIEAGRQGYQLQGNAISSFNSVIDYDLKFSSYFLRTGFVFIVSN